MNSLQKDGHAKLKEELFLWIEIWESLHKYPFSNPDFGGSL